MTELIQDRLASETASLLTCYGFELKGYSASILIHQWLKRFSSLWIRLAVIEALHQGRYKAISVEHILDRWTRLGQPNPRFPHEFDRFICQKLPRNYLDNQPFEVGRLSDRPRLGHKLRSFSDRSTFRVPEPELTLAINHQPFGSPQNEVLDETASTISATTQTTLPPKISSQQSQAESLRDTKRFNSNNNIHKSIRRFTPILDNSLLYNKLRAVAHGQLNLEYQ